MGLIISLGTILVTFAFIAWAVYQLNPFDRWYKRRRRFRREARPFAPKGCHFGTQNVYKGNNVRLVIVSLYNDTTGMYYYQTYVDFDRSEKRAIRKGKRKLLAEHKRACKAFKQAEIGN